MIEHPTAIAYRSRAKRGFRNRGFTLIELLVAIAVTAVLLTLLFGPIIQSFFFTGQAQAEAAAQSTARTTMEQITRELGSAAGIRSTEGKYLNEQIMTQSGTEALARSYNAYLDIVPPRPQTLSPTATAFSDPTVDPNNNTVTLNAATGTEVTPPIILSLAPGTGFVRYFLGLRYPIDLLYTPQNNTAHIDPQPYYNPYDETPAQIQALRTGSFGTSYVVKHDLTNTYIFYRAEVQPTVPEKDANGNIVKDAAGNPIYVPNTELFSSVYGSNDSLGTAGQPEPDSQAITDPNAQPVLDDPDFFRIVTTGDINPITNAAYTNQQMLDHNEHVYFWAQVAKPVIGATVADLIAPPRNARGQVQYYYVDNNGAPQRSPTPPGSMPGGAELWPAVPTNTFATDSQGNPIPVMPTSVSFGPALVANDTLAGTTSEYASQGVGATQFNASGSPPPYLPTVYQAAYGQWQGTPVLTIYQNDQTGTPIVGGSSGSPFTTGAATTAALAAALTTNANLNRSVNPSTGLPYANPQSGDLIEYDNGNNPVYDVTLNAPFQNATHYVALAFSPASGAVSFGLTALPTPATNPTTYNYVDPNDSGSPYWVIPVEAVGATNGSQLGLFYNGTNNEVNFTTLTGSYLNPGDPNAIAGAPPTTTPAAPGVQIAQIVVNSDRVYGPDMTQANSSTSANPASLPMVPYTRVAGTSSAGLQANQYAVNYTTGEFFFALPTTTTGTSAAPPAGSNVQIAFSYQNNAFENVYTSGSATTADTVRATYHTGKLTQVTIGIRLYDLNSGRPVFFSMTNRLVVANAGR